MTKRKALQKLMAPDLYERFMPSEIAKMRIMVRRRTVRKSRIVAPVSLKSCGDLRHVSEVGEK